MKYDFAAAMRRAVVSARALDVIEATRIIQSALRGRTVSEQSDDERTSTNSSPARSPAMLRLAPLDIEIPKANSSAEPHRAAGRAAPDMGGVQPSPRMRRPLTEALRLLREGRSKVAIGPLPGMTGCGTKGRQSPEVPDGAEFLTRSFTCAAGTRGYKLYVPASAHDHPRGLVVMLHGCKQDPDDFAVGTNMNAIAEAHGFVVAYPAQTTSSNASSCWNWFNPGDQMRDAGEPSILAGITREIMAEYQLDRRQVFVAGLSAGGAMAAVMGETYPDLYAAMGIHSGLAYRSANDVMSAFAAMRGERGHASRAMLSDIGMTPPVRTIVFHGCADVTVSPANVDGILSAATGHIPRAVADCERGLSSGGRTYSRRVIPGPDGSSAVECWMVDAVGHAWSGGQAGGSFTDPQGPDASVEMMRFFLAH